MDQSRIAIAAPSAVRSASPAKAWARALEITTQATRDPTRILPRAVAEWGRKYGDAVALVSDQERLSFRGLEARMNQYSRWALDVGVAPGETVALMMGNRPEYFAIWLGLIQVGAIAALVSPSLGASALRRALNVAGAGRVIAAASCADLCAGDRRSGPRGALDSRPRSSGGPTNRPCDFDAERRTARGRRATTGHARRSRTSHFHLRNDRSEQSRRNQSPQAYTLDALVCRARRHDCGRSAL